MNPPPGIIGTLVKETSDPQIKWKTLDEARNRAEWERGKRKREGEKQKERDEEAEAMAIIDWQDFVVVETIEFTQNDMELELPPPTNVDKLKTMSMAEKRMASMVMEETGAGPTGATAAADVDATEEMDMEEDDEGEEVKLQRIKEEQEQARAKDVQRAAMQSRGVKIRTDYTPKGMSHIPLQTCTVSDVVLTCSRYSERRCSGNCQMSKLWSIHPRERTIRAHAYRAPRPQMERTETSTRNASEPVFANGSRNRCISVPPKPRFTTY